MICLSDAKYLDILCVFRSSQQGASALCCACYVQVIKLGHGGIHVVFEAEGTATPLDSPSRLFVTVSSPKCFERRAAKVVAWAAQVPLFLLCTPLVAW